LLGGVMQLCGLNIFKFIRYIKEEILLVLGTSSSELALPLMMRKMEKLGCSKPVVGLVIPMGYSFNLDGTSIYLTLATLFIAQATNTPVSFGEELGARRGEGAVDARPEVGRGGAARRGVRAPSQPAGPEETRARRALIAGRVGVRVRTRLAR
jgi:hypothetical protein